MSDLDKLEDAADAGQAFHPITVKALIAELRELRKDKARLDSGCIMRSDWDDFGDTINIESRGNDLRRQIDEAMAKAREDA